MQAHRLLAAGMIALSVAACVRADAVIMYNGQRLEGQIVGETEDEISLRQTTPTGTTYIRKIHKFNITNVEKAGHPLTQPASAPAEEAPPVRPGEDRLALLESAITKYQQENYSWAGLLLFQLINRSSAGELAYMSADVQKRLNMSLAELAATSHFKAAEPAKPGQRIRLPYVTAYERPVLLKLLKQAHEEALGMSVETTEETTQVVTETTVRKRQQPQDENIAYQIMEQPPRGEIKAGGKRSQTSDSKPAAQGSDSTMRPQPAPPTTPSAERPQQRSDGGAGSLQPTSPQKVAAAVRKPTSRPEAWPSNRPKTAIDWLDRPEEYDGTPAEAEAMVNHVQFTMSLLSERIRLDPKVQRDPALRTALIQEKERLALLLRAAKAQAKGSLTPDERAAILGVRKRLGESHRKEMVPRELLIEEFAKEGRRDGPPPGKYPTTSSSGNVELVPVDVNFP